MNILAVNPWVHDFAYHDLYAKPYGLLMLSSLLRRIGHEVTFLDMLTPGGQNSNVAKRKNDGTGGFYREEIERNGAYGKISRKYYRFGLPPGELLKILKNIPAPDMIIVTSGMTYWHTGVTETIGFLRSVFPGVPVHLGGIYARLLPNHAAQYSGADYIFKGDAFSFVEDILKTKAKADYILPDLEHFYEKLYYVPALTTMGCPFNCPYCASKTLFNGMKFLPVHECVDYLEKYTRLYKTDVAAFYDDALLYEREKHLYPMLQEIIRRGLNLKLYTPNGLHVRFIDKKCASLLKETGFQKLRLSLEFAEDDSIKKYGGKTAKAEFKAAVEHLHNAGFPQKDIGVYLLCGLYGQTKKEIKESIDYVYACGGTPYLSEYSPVPGSALFESDRMNSLFNLDDPQNHNNTILPMQSENFTYMDFLELKKYNRSKRPRV